MLRSIAAYPGQDYIDIAGLKIYQQEMARLINYYTEQEANRYLKKKTFDVASRYQNKAIPIPKLVTSREATAVVARDKVAD